MTKARKEQVSIEDTPYYHCVVNCVRRAYLCGDDYSTGKNYDHRKKWVVDKIKQLSSIFAIDVCAYAVMSNHYHVVLHVDIEKNKEWSVKEVIERWQKLFAGNVLINRYMTDDDMSEAELDAVNDIVKEWRSRLSDISWFMRCLNESIARQSNKEDNCKGRFWEGRFKSQALLDETALLSCMVYVDLNPIRAKMSDTLQDSDFTSIQERIRVFADKENKRKQRKTDDINILTAECRHSKKEISKMEQPKQLLPLIGPLTKNLAEKGIQFSPLDYFELVDWTGRAIREDKRGYIPPEIKPILQQLGVQDKNWVRSVKFFESRFFHIAGAVDRMQSIAAKFKQNWLKGIGSSKQLYSSHKQNDSLLIESQAGLDYQCVGISGAQMDLFDSCAGSQSNSGKAGILVTDAVKKIKKSTIKKFATPVQTDLFDF